MSRKEIENKIAEILQDICAESDYKALIAAGAIFEVLAAENLIISLEADKEAKASGS